MTRKPVLFFFFFSQSFFSYIFLFAVNPDKSQGAGLESSSLVMKPNQSKAVKPVPGSVSMPGLKKKRPSSAGFTKVRKLREMKGTQSSMDKHVPSAESELLQLATIPPDTKPGSDTWQYSSLPLNSRLAVSLSDKWPAIEQTYLVTIRKVACLLRQEREAVCRYIYSRRLAWSMERVKERVVFIHVHDWYEILRIVHCTMYM